MPQPCGPCCAPPGSTPCSSSTCPSRAYPPTRRAKHVAEVLSKTNRTVLACFMGYDPAAGPALTLLNDAGIPTYETPDKAVSAFLHLLRYRKNQELLMEMPASLPDAYAPDPDAARAVVERAFAEGRFALTDPEAKEVLGYYGVRAVASHIVEDVEDAVAAADALGYPVAVKVGRCCHSLINGITRSVMLLKVVGESVNPYISSMCSQISRVLTPLLYNRSTLFSNSSLMMICRLGTTFGSNLNYDPGVCLTRIPLRCF